MRVVISDTSCLLDLRKANLLEAFLQIPYEIGIPDVLFEEELISFTEDEKTQLKVQGLNIMSLNSPGVMEVQSVAKNNRKLSVNDCFAFVLAKQTANSILLTGDRRLRELAVVSTIEVHGVLWVIDLLYSHQAATPKQLHDALLKFQADESVRLPKQELQERLKKYELLS